MLPFGRKARDHGLITSGDAALIDRLATRLANGVFEHDQPALVPVVAARLHGDLWSGNVLWDAGAEGQGVLIDPAAHGGHAESDLAMLALFGQQHLDAIIAGYGQVSPLAAGWQERIALHQVHPLLVHTVLFGGGYAEAAVAAARRYT
ncbi:MAG TPA: fructosamine kinase family protein [Beutenbergiaceae bacterium]|nr:fructosamine kinase family protein [Beutenbergiaceae bacterium]